MAIDPIRHVQVGTGTSATTYSIGTSVAPTGSTQVITGINANTSGTTVAANDHTHTGHVYFTKTTVVTGVNAGSTSVAVASSNHNHDVTTITAVLYASFANGVLTISTGNVVSAISANSSTTNVATYNHGHGAGTASVVSTMTSTSTTGYTDLSITTGGPSKTTDVASKGHSHGVSTTNVASTTHTH